MHKKKRLSRRIEYKSEGGVLWWERDSRGECRKVFWGKQEDRVMDEFGVQFLADKAPELAGLIIKEALNRNSELMGGEEGAEVGGEGGGEGGDGDEYVPTILLPNFINSILLLHHTTV
ncbi:MAG: hypothetical protein CV087_23615 [Candidatus Brocadia sp. WS118]|nr:MAG: hypothetical protein CV087_23615 [Candidatus Brocadia sp. WS118]